LSDVDPRRYLLSEADSERIFQVEIAPERLQGGQAVERPVAVFVAGQPGAGKTKTTEAVRRRFDDHGGAVGVCGDFYKPYHPEYGRLLDEDDRTAGPYTSLDARRWNTRAEQYLIERRVNVVIETTMRDPGDFIDPAAMFRAAGYRVEVAIMAVPQAQSRLGILSRYEQMVAASGHGRMVETANHDACYAAMLDAADLIDRDQVVDVVAVYRRGNHLLYANSAGIDGDWAAPAATRRTIEAERDREWTAAEAGQFLDEWQRLVRALPPDWHPRLEHVASLARPHLPGEIHDALPLTPPSAESKAAGLPDPQNPTYAALARPPHDPPAPRSRGPRR
jgi:UDP-N-acetylglucosamine kinase